ncbi:MAG: hypothetical protein R6X31_13995 [Anaerolineae bacterium]
MRVLFRWLVQYAWAFYVVCAIGALIYLVRALSAQREKSLALFTLEHETATVRAVRAWVMVFVFVAIALVVFISASFLSDRVPAYEAESPPLTATPRSGVEPPTPSPTPPPTQPVTTPTSASEAPPASPTPPPSPTEPPTADAEETPTPTPLPSGPLSGAMDVRFGSFAQLTGYEVSSDQIATGEPLAITLYWQALEGTGPVNYTVFTHLLSPDGRLIAQHDGPPAGGAAPTSQWQAGQTIQDTHQLSFRSEGSDYTGPATVMVGFYDPGDVTARVVTDTGQDYAVLPVTVNVRSP